MSSMSLMLMLVVLLTPPQPPASTVPVVEADTSQPVVLAGCPREVVVMINVRHPVIVELAGCKQPVRLRATMPVKYRETWHDFGLQLTVGRSAGAQPPVVEIVNGREKRPAPLLSPHTEWLSFFQIHWRRESEVLLEVSIHGNWTFKVQAKGYAE